MKERVLKRCGSDLAVRFESMTFDAFAKNIVDRFRKGLPESYAVNSEYEIIFGERDILDVFEGIDRNYRSTHSDKQILDDYYSKLPLSPDSIHYKAWTHQLSGAKSFLTFKMMMRLAELIMDANPKLREYLKATYSHIFLDEFQDTTTLQYEFLTTCFGDSGSVLTAVGDDKQRIMLWAGALPEIFSKFIEDYDASQLSLQMNFRSAPNLVELQNYLITNLPMIGHQKLEFRKIMHFDELINKETVKKNIQVSSMRLDAIIARTINISRSRACDIIEEGNVSIHHLVCKNTDHLCHIGDMISIRKFGRITIIDNVKITKKERLVLLVGVNH